MQFSLRSMFVATTAACILVLFMRWLYDVRIEYFLTLVVAIVGVWIPIVGLSVCALVETGKSMGRLRVFATVCLVFWLVLLSLPSLAGLQFGWLAIAIPVSFFSGLFIAAVLSSERRQSNGQRQAESNRSVPRED